MTIRNFVFCDVCNPQAFRSVETRRNTTRKTSAGRRISDGRSWLEGTEKDAIASGWILDGQGRHVCERCVTRSLHKR